MVIQYEESNKETHTFEVIKDGFKGKVIIADHNGLIYVRQVLPIKGSEKLQNFKFKAEIEAEVEALYKEEYKHRVNNK